MESTQRSPGLRTRTQGTRLENGLNLFGAGVNLGPLRPPPAAARAGQIRRSFFPNIAPLVCLAFSALFGRGRPMWRPVRRARRPGAPRRRKVRCAQDAQAWASLAALPCSSFPRETRCAGLSRGPRELGGKSNTPGRRPGVLNVLKDYRRLKNAVLPGYSEMSPSSSSMRSSWLYLATRSVRLGAPVLIWPAFRATAMSAMVVSSVSPER